MEILVERFAKKNSYTVGRLYIDNELICNTLEDKDRGLRSDMNIDEIKHIKVSNETAIPTGRYEVTIDVISPKFSKYQFYMDTCNGRLPRLLNVPGFDGILIHVGSTAKNTSGCILVGLNTEVGMLTEGKRFFEIIYNRMKEAKSKGESVFITIK